MKTKLKLIALSGFIGLASFLALPADDFAGDARSVTAAAYPVEIFTANCAKCHGTDGRAKTAKGKRLHATDFTTDWNTDETRGIHIITNGKDDMPSFKKTLSPDEIRSVFHYVVSLKQ
jgi:mono/diheme cytochrome c family protein